MSSPSIISTDRSLGGSGLTREPHSLDLTERVDSAETPESRSETRWSPVRPAEAATSQMLELERSEKELEEEEGATELVGGSMDAHG